MRDSFNLYSSRQPKGENKQSAAAVIPLHNRTFFYFKWPFRQPVRRAARDPHQSWHLYVHFIVLFTCKQALTQVIIFISRNCNQVENMFSGKLPVCTSKVQFCLATMKSNTLRWNTLSRLTPLSVGMYILCLKLSYFYLVISNTEVIGSCQQITQHSLSF